MGGIVDESRCHWREEDCSELGISPSLLPPIHSPLDVVGETTPQAAEETGLAVGTPVLCGTTDTFATLVGNGITMQGEAMVYYGTTGLLTVCNQDLEKVLAKPWLVDDETPFILAAYLLNFGESLEWFLIQLLQVTENSTEYDIYQAMETGAAKIPPGCEGLLVMPHFSGRILPKVEPFTRGAFIGLSTRHNRFHLWRALLESFGHYIRQSALRQRARGIPLKRVVASGGGARSELWRQIVSDITGLSQEYVADGDAVLGSAFLAGLGLGLVSDFSAMRESWLQVQQMTRPDHETKDQYSKLFAVYQDLDSVLGIYQRALLEASCASDWNE
jgi:xylulokinase